MLTVRNDQLKAMGDAAPNRPVIQSCKTDPHWIEFRLVDQKGAPVPGEPYKVRLPDQSLRTGTTDQDGKVRFECITAGDASICYTGFDKIEWKGV